MVIVAVLRRFGSIGTGKGEAGPCVGGMVCRGFCRVDVEDGFPRDV